MRLVAIAIAVLALTATDAAARTPKPSLTTLRCVPATRASCASGVAVTTGQLVQLRGRNLARDMRVSFRWSRGALATRLKRSSAGWVARVPTGVPPGTIKLSVSDRAGRRSNVVKIKIVRSGPLPVVQPPIGDLPGQFAGPGMWVWEVPRTEGGNLDKIIARARATGMQTLYVKAADGANTWAQFTPALVQRLHAAGLRVCGWQFVYGSEAAKEAAAAITAIQRGADCFVIDAESRYEGRYAAAASYVTKLRAAVGASYPLALTSFPYVDYHPWLPYSVFLGAVQANLPQVYWKDIGTTVDAASAHTFAHNRVYQRPMAPLGQTYQSPPASQLRRFRAVWAAYGAGGLSWWVWQQTPDSAWSVLTEAAPAPAVLADPGWPLLAKGARGDQVVWLQQHLQAVSPQLAIDGRLQADDIAALQAFQTSKGIVASGQTDPATWAALLALAPVAVDWTARPAPGATTARAARAAEIPSVG
jgi:hypothetical protein